MMLLPNRKTWDVLTVAVGVIGLIIINVAAWLPQPCPLLRHALIGCPRTISVAPTTALQQELARIPHQTIFTAAVYFASTSQTDRSTTQVSFYYQASPLEQDYLELKQPSGFQKVALITHPLLKNLSWSSINSSNYHLYQQNSTFASINDFIAHLPPAQTVAADDGVAQALHLQPNQYTPLSNIATVEQVKYILTTYTAPVRDGSWQYYTYTVNAQGADITQEKKLQWEIIRENMPQEPLQLGTVHINYRDTHTAQ